MIKMPVNNSKFNSVFIKVFIVLILFSIAPMLIANAIIYTKSISTIEEQTYNTNINILKKTSQMVDVVFKHVGQTIQDLSRDPDIVNAVINPDINAVRRNNDIITNLKSLRSMNKYIHSVYVYSAYDNTVISSDGGVYKLDDFNDKAWLDAYSKPFLGTYQLHTRKVPDLSGNQHNCITLIRNLPYSSWSKIGAIVVNIDEEKLYSEVGIDTNGGGEIYVVDKKGAVLLSRDKSRLSASFFDFYSGNVLKDYKGFFIEKVAGQKNLFTYITSTYNYWTYVHVIPIKDLPDNSKTVSQIILTVTLIYALFGLIISFLISRGIYSPIKNLMNLAGISTEYTSDSKDMAAKDEYELLGHAYSDIMDRNKSMTDILNKVKPAIKEKLFSNLIVGKNDNLQEIIEKLDFLNINFDTGNFIVIAMQIDDYKKFLNRFDEKDRSLYKIQLVTMVERVISQKYQGICIETESDKVAAVINFAGNISSIQAKEESVTFAANIKKEVMENFPFTVTFGIGRIYKDIRNINLSYKEAENSLKYKLYQGKNEIIDIDNVEFTTEELYYYNSEKENMLINSIRVGQKKDVEILIDELFEEILNSRNIQYEYLHQEFTRIVSSIVELIINRGMTVDEIFGPKYNLYEELSTKETISDIKTWISQVCYKVADAIDSINLTRSQKYAEKIIDYINENSHLDISLNDISECVGLSPAYTSKIFKECVGKNYTDYLNSIRVVKAKQLLQDTQLSVKEIGFKAGFNSIQAFVRTFKKYEGVSPGQFRDKA